MAPKDNKNIGEEIQQVYSCLHDNNLNQAQDIFNHIVSQKVEDIENLTLLGDLASRLGEKIVAINIFHEIVENHSGNHVHMLSLAQAYIENNMLLQAEELINKAIELQPEYYHSYIKLSCIAIQMKKHTKAIELLEKARQLKPGDSAIYTNLVTALIQSDKPDEACEYAKKLIKLAPDNAENYYLLGRALNGKGDFDGAIKNFEKTIRLKKTMGNAYYDIATSRKFSPSDKVGSSLIKKAESALQISMPAKERACIHYALGKVFNDHKKWDKAFDHYKQGNLLRKPAVSVEMDINFFNKTYKFYNARLFQQAEQVSSSSRMPVFVVGMPRSGSTLIEQIIASHPDASGVGEISDIPLMVQSICPTLKPEDLKKSLSDSIDNGVLTENIEAYLKVLGESGENVTRVVDKKLENFLLLGLIHLIFPNSYIIHARRSPLDTALSCFFQAFDSLDWANDLQLIARRYKSYRKVMSCWEAVLPEGRVIDVHYEKMIADPEGQARKLISSIGLDWDPSCLEFYKHKRSINTASYWQVRQPVYTSSKKRWVNYAKYFEILANDLYDFLDEEEIATFSQQGINLKKKGWFSSLMRSM